MKYFSIYQRKIHLWFVFGSCLALAAVIFLMPSWQHVDFSGSQMYTVTLNGTEVGVVGSEEEAERDLIAARRAVASGSGDLMYMKAELSLSGRQVLWGRVDDRSVVVRHMKDVLKGSVRSSKCPQLSGALFHSQNRRIYGVSADIGRCGLSAGDCAWAV